MNFSKIKPAIPFLIFFIFIFLFMPFIQSSRTIDPEVTWRYFFLSVFFISFSIFCLIFYRRKTVTINKHFRFILIAIAALVGWSGITVIYSINKGDGFTEWMRLCELYSIIIILGIIGENKSDLMRYASFSALIANFIFICFGFVQLVPQWSDYVKQTPLHQSLIIPSTLSNKNFFSEVLVLFLPFIISGILTEIKVSRLLFICGLVLNILFLILNQTIASWIAVAISILVFFLFSAYLRIPLINKRISRKRKIGTLLFILTALACGVYIYAKTPNYKILTGRISRTVEYLHNPELLNSYRVENNNSTFERLIIWRNSFHIIASSPIFGTGLNNWKLLYPKFGIGGTQYINSGFLSYEHPHNDYLLIWSEQGVVGLLIYLLFFILIIYAGIKVIRREEIPRIKIPLLLFICGVVSFMIMSMFAYPRSRFYSMVLLMTISGIIIMASKKKSGVVISCKYLLIPVLVFATAGTVASFYRLNGELHQMNILSSQVNGNFARMLRESEKAESWFYPLDATSTPVCWYNGLANFYSHNIPGAIINYEKALTINPNHIRTMNDLATCYEQSGEREKSISLYRKALAITPLFIEGNLNISAAYYNISQIDSAYYFIDKIYSLPMSMAEEQNYHKFLRAILEAKEELKIKQGKGIALDSFKYHILPGDSLERIYLKTRQE
jgi:O-antigen ligase